MKNDILKYCLYYKGEKKCPEREKFVCTDKEYHLYWRFWCFEAEYYFGAFQNKTRKMWERLGSNMFKDPQFQGAWKDPKWSKIQLGFMAYAECMPPDYISWVCDYGKCTNLKRKPKPKPKTKTAWEGMMEICRYYRGGKVNPYPWGTAKAHFWELEWEFANNYYQKDQRLENEYNLNVIAAFPDQLAKAPYGVIYLPLKAFLHARYYNFGGSDAGFPAYLDYYLKNQ